MNPVVVSCPDVECQGTVENTFDEKEGKQSAAVECNVCDNEYTMIYTNWSDTPDEERIVGVTFQV